MNESHRDDAGLLTAPVALLILNALAWLGVALAIVWAG